MKIKYYCTNQDCKATPSGAPVLELDLDAVMDENNLAQMFCPYCKAELHPKLPASGPPPDPCHFPDKNPDTFKAFQGIRAFFQHVY